MMVCAVIIFSAAARRWALVLTGKVATADLSTRDRPSSRADPYDEIELAVAIEIADTRS